MVGFLSVGVSEAWGIEREKIDGAVLSQLDSLESDVNLTYDAMLAMLKSNQQDVLINEEIHKSQQNTKQRMTQQEIDAKKKRIEAERQAAWEAACIQAIYAGQVVASAAAATSSDVQNLYVSPNDQGFQRFMANANALKRNVAQLRTAVNRLRDIRNSGKIDKVPTEKLVQIKTQLETSLQQLRDKKKFVRDHVRK
jgi:uncharacterized membrane-anchored protein YjiN (DUF445 family)